MLNDDSAAPPGAGPDQFTDRLSARINAARASTLGIKPPDKALLCVLMNLLQFSNDTPCVSRRAAAEELDLSEEQVHEGLLRLHETPLVDIAGHEKGSDRYPYQIALDAIQGRLDEYRAMRDAEKAAKGPYGKGRAL